MHQIEMFPDGPVRVTGGRLGAFLAFHRDNPKVWKLFKRFSEQALQAGRERYGAHCIGERIRWHTSVETKDPDFKLNDHHLPYYARLLAGTDERFAGFFEFRDGHFDSSVDEIVRLTKF